VDVTVGWCSEFEPAWRINRLFRASRPPALFQYHLGRYLGAIGEPLTGRVILDEDLGMGSLSQDAEAAISAADIVFLCSHGRMDGTTYRLRLRQGEWAPTDSPQSAGPTVLVLDTCNVVRKGVKPEHSAWSQVGRWSPTIVLGFVGPATSGYSESMRGRALAEHLAAGETYATAWFNAIQDTQPRRYRDCAIAMAFGPTEAQARASLQGASLANPPARTVADACWWKIP
jgi:Family of unknown function (DUF6345)